MFYPHQTPLTSPLSSGTSSSPRGDEGKSSPFTLQSLAPIIKFLDQELPLRDSQKQGFLKAKGGTQVRDLLLLAPLRIEQSAFGLSGSLPEEGALTPQTSSLKQERTVDLLILEAPRYNHNNSMIIVKAQLDHGRNRNSPSSETPIKTSRPEEIFSLFYFNYKLQWLERALVVGKTYRFQGQIKKNDYGYYLSQAKWSTPKEKLAQSHAKACYSSTLKVPNAELRRWIKQALIQMPLFPEWITGDFIEEFSPPTFDEALRALHQSRKEAFEPLERKISINRLAYDEVLAQQTALILARKAQHKIELPHTAYPKSRDFVPRCLADLPFELTEDQNLACNLIEQDLSATTRLHRLIQGDVGSGKTILAILAGLQVCEGGGQVALMAPTTLLAQQHYESLEPLASRLGINIALVTGDVKGKARNAIAQQLQEGDLHFVVGTHALFSKSFQYKQLGLVIVDEQHRFGVKQRLLLSEKGQDTNFLMMSATPIPRSLLMASYDLDISLIKTKPSGRIPIKTTVTSIQRLDEITERLKQALLRQEQAYWICPKIDDSTDKLGKTNSQEESSETIASSELRYQYLKSHFPAQDVALIHGKIPLEEREKILHRYREGKIKLLVSTTVIEVGINVPSATIMIIEQAERFGLAQLHQLRGRVGRGSKASACLLIYYPDLTKTGQERLKTLVQSSDGFNIAEADLKHRGGGDILGVKQAGFPKTTFFNLQDHYSYLKIAFNQASDLLERDPQLNLTSESVALRLLLHFFRKHEALDYLKA